MTNGKHNGIDLVVAQGTGLFSGLQLGSQFEIALGPAVGAHYHFHGSALTGTGVTDVDPFALEVGELFNAGIFAGHNGKRVNIGNPGSGQRGTMEVVMGVYGWDKGDFKLASELKSAEQSKALCDNKIDAMVFTVGHPSGSIKEAATSCDSVMVAVAGPEIDALVKEADYYRTATIPGGMYRGTPTDTKTFGVGATFVSSSTVPDNVIYNVVKAVFDNFDQFKKLHPAFKNLKESEMIKDGLSAPLHNGAKKYYKERGWM